MQEKFIMNSAGIACSKAEWNKWVESGWDPNDDYDQATRRTEAAIVITEALEASHARWVGARAWIEPDNEQ